MKKRNTKYTGVRAGAVGAQQIVLLVASMVLAGVIGGGVMSKAGGSAILDKANKAYSEFTTVGTVSNHWVAINGDFSNMNYSDLFLKGLVKNITVTGTGASSTATAPWDTSFSFGLSAAADGRSYTWSTTGSTSFNTEEKQLFEDKMNSMLLKSGGTVSGYTASGADGAISVTIYN